MKTEGESGRCLFFSIKETHGLNPAREDRFYVPMNPVRFLWSRFLEPEVRLDRVILTVGSYEIGFIGYSRNPFRRDHTLAQAACLA